MPALRCAHLGGWSGNSCYFADVSKNGQNPLVLVAFLLCLWCVALEMCLYSHFKGVFSGVWGVCVGLCCLRALRGLWGFCVREWLGGFMACCVFAPLLSSLLSSFLSFCSCFPCLSSCPLCLPCLFLCPCGFCRCFFFPYG